MLLFYNQLALKNQGWPERKDFPWFRLVASVIAFAVWALCIPGKLNPFASDDQPAFGVLFGVIAVIVAVLLPLIENFYNLWRNRPNESLNAGSTTTTEPEAGTGP